MCSCFLYKLLHQPIWASVYPRTRKTWHTSSLLISFAACSLLGTRSEGNKAAASEPSMNYARKWHEAIWKRLQSWLENRTNQAWKWHKPVSKMARIRLENSTNQARKWHKPVSKVVRTRHGKRTNQAWNQHEKSFNSSVLGSKLGTQNGSNQGTIEESMLHKWQATPCASQRYLTIVPRLGYEL